MISESLKINTTLTTLYLDSDDKIKKWNVGRKENDNVIDNKQGTILEQKEPRW